MGIIKGPYSPEDWLMMLVYKTSVNKLITKNSKSGVYQSMIDREREVLREYYQKEVA